MYKVKFLKIVKRRSFANHLYILKNILFTFKIKIGLENLNKARRQDLLEVLLKLLILREEQTSKRN